MKSLFVVLLSVVLLAGCEKREFHSEQVRQFTVENVYRGGKSSVYVDLRDVQTGYVYTKMKLGSKSHCGDWQSIKIGGKWDIYETTYVYRSKQRYVTDLNGLYALCPNARK